MSDDDAAPTLLELTDSPPPPLVDAGDVASVPPSPLLGKAPLVASTEPATPLPLVPVTIISGFLGAGKTTLLNYILTAHHGKRIAVIENEFGDEIGVENLIAKNGADGQVFDDFYELSNGCICCSVRDDLLNTLERLLERRDRFDYILIETTGMANPGKVASMFWVDAELEGRIYLDGIVTLVDAPRISYLLDHRDTHLEAASQLAYADRILMNKQDLIRGTTTDDDDAAPFDIKAEAIERRVREINGVAQLQWTERAKIDLDEILNIKSFTTQRAQEVEEVLRNGEHAGIHTGGIQTTCVTLADGAFVLEKLERWLGELLWEQTDSRKDVDDQHTSKYFRIKGVLAIAGEKNKYVLQAVHELFEVYATEEPWDLPVKSETTEAKAKTEVEIAAPHRVSRIVFIGLHLNRLSLEEGLRTCLIG